MVSKRYIRDEEIVGVELQKTRDSVKDVQSPTGTEKALTKDVAEQAAVDADFAKQLAEQLEVELGPLPGQVQEALDEAQTALTEAGLARSEAAEALSDAQQAINDAAQAIANALSAANAASDAQDTADAAQTSAGNAQTSANQAIQDALDAANAAAAADSKAVAAQGSANTAQATADSKGKVLIQSAAPSVADRLPQNLWIDTTGGNNTPKRWSGSAWVAVTDKAAIDAANAAAAAQQRADDAFDEAVAAATAAGNAQSSADGKNTVWYQDSAPAGSGHTVDDIWFDTDDGMRMSRWNGSSWQIRQFGTNAIQNLAITNALIANAAIDDAKIANLDAGKITSGFIAAARIAALSISTDKLAAEAVTAAKIAALTITAGQLAANSVIAAKIAAGAIITEKLAAGAVATDKLDALAVTAEKIAVGAIIAEKIAAGAITTAKLAADAIDGMTITGAIIRTAATGQRVQLDVLGLRTFNSSNAETARLSSDGTGLRLSGPLMSVKDDGTAAAKFDVGIVELTSNLGTGWTDRTTLTASGLSTNIDSGFYVGNDSNEAGTSASLYSGSGSSYRAGISVSVGSVGAPSAVVVDADNVLFKGDQLAPYNVVIAGYQNGWSPGAQFRWVKHGNLVHLEGQTMADRQLLRITGSLVTFPLPFPALGVALDGGGFFLDVTTGTFYEMKIRLADTSTAVMEVVRADTVSARRVTLNQSGIPSGNNTRWRFSCSYLCQL